MLKRPSQGHYSPTKRNPTDIRPNIYGYDHDPVSPLRWIVMQGVHYEPFPCLSARELC